MTIVDRTFARLIGAALVLVLLIPPITAAQSEAARAPEQYGPGRGEQSQAVEPQSQLPITATPTGSAAASASQLPDSPGAMRSQAADSAPSQTDAPQASPAPAQQQRPPGTANEPAGTAAAEAVKTTGVPASKPAGAAIAPAKQRRVRSILIKVGAIAGAGAAIGTTVALSKASPSKPPGH
jgi:hypothetical protein